MSHRHCTDQADCSKEFFGKFSGLSVLGAVSKSVPGDTFCLVKVYSSSAISDFNFYEHECTITVILFFGKKKINIFL